MRGGGKVTDFFKGNGLWIFLGLLILAAVIIAILLFAKPVERFTSQPSPKVFAAQ